MISLDCALDRAIEECPLLSRALGTDPDGSERVAIDSDIADQFIRGPRESSGKWSDNRVDPVRAKHLAEFFDRTPLRAAER
jgi:hypothetical protein